MTEMASALTIRTPKEIIQTLRDQKFTELDLYLNQVQHAYETEQLSEADLQYAFRAFESEFQTLGDPLVAWVEQHPESYAAHQALSQWLLGQAWRHRGGTTFNLVSDRSRRGMQHHLEQAEGCARVAIGLTRKPLLAFLVLAGINNTHGNRMSLEDVQQGRFPDWYMDGLAIAPHSLELREWLLSTLRTEWGGSDQHMLTYIRMQEGQLSSADLQKLWAQFNASLSHHACFFLKDLAKAQEHIDYAVQLNPLLQAERGYILYAAGQKEEARRLLLGTLKEQQNNPRFVMGENPQIVLINLLGPHDLNQDHVYPYFKRLAEDGELGAFWKLGHLLERMKNLPVSETPEDWYAHAVREGDARSAGFLVDRVVEIRGTTDQLMRAVWDGAEAGNAFCCGVLYENFKFYQKAFQLDERAQYTYLLRAADAGDNPSRMELAKLLKAGKVELGEDGVLRPIQGKPTQQSLHYAEHLEQRARAEEYLPVEGSRRKTEFGLIHKKDLSKIPQAQENTMAPIFRHWWVLLLVLWFGIRACGATDRVFQKTEENTRQHLQEQLKQDPETQKLLRQLQQVQEGQ